MHSFIFRILMLFFLRFSLFFSEFILFSSSSMLFYFCSILCFYWYPVCFSDCRNMIFAFCDSKLGLYISKSFDFRNSFYVFGFEIDCFSLRYLCFKFRNLCFEVRNFMLRLSFLCFRICYYLDHVVFLFAILFCCSNCWFYFSKFMVKFSICLV